ncbi:hypothetical protein [Anaerobacillus sp. 1_MG-2023]|nr:hypothetical protein [Anaerobacillus sp. 1_MG-2023]MDO6657428.1 hypothetical protein [Anaerobacillus sp. 1_MG-2023]
MNKSLSTFMIIAVTAVILFVLIGSVSSSLFNKNDEHQEIIKNEYNLKIN